MNRHAQALVRLQEGTVIPAIPLALTADRRFDEARQRALIRYYLDAGVGGIAVAVHTTQFEIRKPEIGLFEPILQLVAEEMDRYETATGKVLVRVAGVCGPEGQAISEAETAKRLGYDAVLLSPGGLQDRSEEDLIRRTKAVAEVLPVIGFYLQTAVGGRNLSFEYWKAVSEIDNVVAIKSAPFNRYQTLNLVRGVAFSRRAKEVALYTGNDDNIVIDLLTRYAFNVNGKIVEKQFIGGLLGHWSVWTRKAVELFERIQASRDAAQIPSELLTLAAEVTDANGAFFDVNHNFEGCIAGIHEVLRRQGLLEGIWCLNPAETLSPGQAEEIDRVYALYPHLNDDGFIAGNLKKWLE